jgi:cobalt-zinc-cadmium efflux system outer membrane protein
MRRQAGLRPNPTVSIERREQPAGTDNQTIGDVQWPLDLFRRATRIAVADQELVAAERSVDDRARLLLSDVRMRYGDAASAVRDVEIADNVAVSARQQVDVLRRRVDEGAAPPLERDLMEVELRRLESDRLVAAGRADAALFELRRAIGLAVDTPLMLRDTLEMLVPSPVSNPEGADAITTPEPRGPASPIGDRPDIREAETRVRVADAKIARAHNDGRFDMTLFGSYMRMDQGFPQRGFHANDSLEPIRGVFHYLSAGAMVTVPLNNRNQGEVARAQAERVGAAARLEAVELAARTELAAAEAQDAQTRRAAGWAEGAVRLGRQNLEVVRQTYELGGATVAEVLAEQRRYLEVEHAYTETLKAAYVARTALQRARGER